MRFVGERFCAIVALSALLDAGNMARGQVTSADIVGRVSDASGAIVPAAQITLSNLDTNNSRSADSNESGDFAFNLLQPGLYSVRV